MELTTSGVVILPLLMMVAVFQWRLLVPITIVLSPLASMSVLDAPSLSLSLQPPAAAATLLLLRGGWYGLQRPNSALTYLQRWCLAPLVVLLCWAGFSAITLPRAFRDVEVRNADGDTVLLEPSLLHVTQFGYLLMGVALAIVVPIAVRSAGELRTASRAMVYSGWLAFLLGLVQIQLAGTTNALTRFLFSNQGFLILVDQRIDSQVRMASTLIEPSVAAIFFGGYTAFVLRLSLDRSPILPRAVLVLSVTIGVVGTVMTLATTGFVTLAIMLLVALLMALRERRSVHVVAAGVVALSCMIIATAAAIRFGLISSTSGPWTRTVSLLTTEKADSESGEERLAGEQLAMEGFEQSLGLGLGWGSSRAFSLTSTVLANLGIPGVAIAAWCFLRLRRAVRTTSRLTLRSGSALTTARALGAALITIFAGAAFSAPDIAYTFMWLPLGLMVAALGVANRPSEDRRLPSTRLVAEGARPEDGPPPVAAVDRNDAGQ